MGEISAKMTKLKCWRKIKGKALGSGRRISAWENESKGKVVEVGKNYGEYHATVGTKKNGYFIKATAIRFENRKGSIENPVPISGKKQKALSLANKYMKEHDSC